MSHDQQETSVHKKVQQMIKGTRNKQTVTWEVSLDTQQSNIVVNNILDQTTKSELSQYFHAPVFRPTTTSPLKAINMGFLRK